MSTGNHRDVESLRGIPAALADVDNENRSDLASNKIWELYGTEADKHDKELTETWKEETGSMLIFTGLFSGVVSAFIIETYKMLLPDNGGTTVALLTQLVTQSQPNGSTSPIPSTVPPAGTQVFKPSRIAIRINILMFLSLFLSLTCALMSTLIQQWAREYLQYSQIHAPPRRRGRVRAYLFEGLTKFQMRRMAESIPVFLHVSVFLFFFAISEFLRTVHDTVGLAAKSCVIVLLSAYAIFSVCPLVVSSSPYRTALTIPLRPFIVTLLFVLRLPIWIIRGGLSDAFRSLPGAAVRGDRSREQDLVSDTKQRASHLDYLVLKWLLSHVHEESMDKFVTGLPALARPGALKDAKRTMEKLVEHGMIWRVENHLSSSMSLRELSPAMSITRAFACLETLDSILSIMDQQADNSRYIIAATDLIKTCDRFCTRQNSSLALRAACIRALTFRKLIGLFAAPTTSQPSWLPALLFPLAFRFQTWTFVNSRLWRNQSKAELGEVHRLFSQHGAHSIMEYDGHLINFLVLIRDVLSYAELPTLDLSPVWETLETMVGALSITRPPTSSSARSRFEEVHTDVCEYLYSSDKGPTRKGLFNVSQVVVSPATDNSFVSSVGGLSGSPAPRIPNRPRMVNAAVHGSLPVFGAERCGQLLEFMDKVAKGLRLVAVLSAASLPQPGVTEPSSPIGGFRLRHNQIYSQDPFSSFEVLNAFSSALPTFISSTSRANACQTVEKMVAVDDLLYRINGYLVTSVNSEVPKAMREQMSLTCLKVLEDIFMLLKGSMTVHWYEVGVDTIINSVNDIAISDTVDNLSTIRAYCVLGIINHVIIGQLRSRIVQGQLPTIQNPEEQLFILKVYDWMCLEEKQEGRRRRGQRQVDRVTNKEAYSPQYLRDLLTNGPLQNFSIMASHLVPHLTLNENESIPESAWETLHKLMDVPGLEDTEDDVALDYFCEVRKRAYDMVIEEEGGQSREQLALLKLLNTVAGRLRFPEWPMPNEDPP